VVQSLANLGLLFKASVFKALDLLILSFVQGLSTMISKENRVYIAGSNGLVGSSIRRELENRGYRSLFLPTSTEVNLIDQKAVTDFFSREKPEVVLLAAAKVGGILANDTFPADFIYNNLMIEANVIQAAFAATILIWRLRT